LFLAQRNNQNPLYGSYDDGVPFARQEKSQDSEEFIVKSWNGIFLVRIEMFQNVHGSKVEWDPVRHHRRPALNGL
jgi:hypothetical protein